MLTYLYRLCVLLLGLLACGFPLSARAETGLQVSLTTSGYRFANGSYTVYVSPKAGRPAAAQVMAAPTDFLATVAISNFTDADVPVSFADASAAVRHWTFRIYNSSGEILWASEEDSTEPWLKTASPLKAKSSWRRMVRVPLQVNGATLPVGRYTLDASLAGTPVLGATAAFEVTDAQLAADTGIKGQVFTADFNLNPGSVPLGSSNLSPGFYGPPVLATVKVNQVLVDNTKTGFTWTGPTDGYGNFLVATPPGVYEITAVAQEEPNPSNPVNVARTVLAVVAGKFSTAKLYVPLLSDVVPATPPADTGLVGKVTEIAPDGSPSIYPVAGLSVRMQAARFRVLSNPTGGFLPYFPSATTDAQGAFKLQAVPGAYHLSVYRDVMPGVYDSATSVLLTVKEVVVLKGQFVKLGINVSPATSSEPVLVSKITDLRDFTLVPAGQPVTAFSVRVQGTVPSTGWAPTLRPRPTVTPGELEFDLVAVPPVDDSSKAGITSISVVVAIPSANVKKVRVYSASNFLELTTEGTGLLHMAK